MYCTEGTENIFFVVFVCISLAVLVVEKIYTNHTNNPLWLIMVYKLPNMIECVINVILTDETHWCI